MVGFKPSAKYTMWSSPLLQVHLQRLAQLVGIPVQEKEVQEQAKTPKPKYEHIQGEGIQIDPRLFELLHQPRRSRTEKDQKGVLCEEAALEQGEETVGNRIHS